MLALSETSLTSLMAALSSAAAEKTTDVSQSPFQGMLPILGILAIFFYFIILRPQKKERKQRQDLLDSIKKGDRVVSIGGIHGKVADLNDVEKTVTVDVGSKVTMKFSRTAIQTVDPKDSGKKPGKDTKDKK